MRIPLRLALIGVLAAASSTAVAGPLEDASAAYQRHDYATALRVWRPLAENGDVAAQISLAGAYWLGQGVPQDYAEAAAWYRKAADQGDAHAQFSLGVLYANGEGVPEDFEEAVKWYRKAADQGDAYAENNLAVLYGAGLGVPQDFVLAYMWFNLAAAQGTANAVHGRDLTANQMTPSQIAEAQRLAREWRPKVVASWW